MRLSVALTRSAVTLGLALLCLTTWGEAQTARVAPGALTGFGTAVVLAGNEILVSRTGQSPFIPLKPDRAGAVHVFRQAADGSWAETAILEATDGIIGNEFGDGMAVGGGTLAVVSPNDNDGDGMVHLFTRN